MAVSKTKRGIVLSKTKSRCAYCTDVLSPDWHVDHFYPISFGGTDAVDNLFASCPRCNLRKGNRVISGFSSEDWFVHSMGLQNCRESVSSWVGVGYSDIYLFHVDVRGTFERFSDLCHDIDKRHGEGTMAIWVRMLYPFRPSLLDMCGLITKRDYDEYREVPN